MTRNKTVKKINEKEFNLEHDLKQSIYMHPVCNNFVCKSRSLTLQYMKLYSYIVKFCTFQGENIVVYKRCSKQEHWYQLSHV